MRRLLITFGLLITNSAYADTCIPKPDCADMGYTETSCSGAYLKCPFDTSKVICLREKITNCLAGSYFYTDRTCSSTLDSSKTILGLVVKDNELIMSKPVSGITWAPQSVGIDNITDEVMVVLTDDGNSTARMMLGKFDNLSGASTSTMAVLYCDEYSPSGASDTKGKWYLPTVGGLKYAYSASFIHQNSEWIQKVWSVNSYESGRVWVVKVAPLSHFSQRYNAIEIVSYNDTTIYTTCFLNIANL